MLISRYTYYEKIKLSIARAGSSFKRKASTILETERKSEKMKKKEREKHEQLLNSVHDSHSQYLHGYG